MIMVAAFFDTFVGTGYLLYGFALLGTAALMHLDGMVSVTEIVLAASVGTIAASATNFSLGRFFGHTAWVHRRLDTPVVHRLRRILDRYGTWWFIIIGRSVTFFRPSYALLLGLMHRPWQKFLVMEILYAILWVIFWTGVILAGEEVLLKVFN